MAKIDNLEELMGVLEQVRSESYPHIPAKLIRDLVLVQYEKQDNRPKAREETLALVYEFLAKTVQEGKGE